MIKIKVKEIEMTLEEARELHRELSVIFGQNYTHDPFLVYGQQKHVFTPPRIATCGNEQFGVAA